MIGEKEGGMGIQPSPMGAGAQPGVTQGLRGAPQQKADQMSRDQFLDTPMPLDEMIKTHPNLSDEEKKQILDRLPPEPIIATRREMLQILQSYKARQSQSR